MPTKTKQEKLSGKELQTLQEASAEYIRIGEEASEKTREPRVQLKCAEAELSQKLEALANEFERKQRELQDEYEKDRTRTRDGVTEGCTTLRDAIHDVDQQAREKQGRVYEQVKSLLPKLSLREVITLVPESVRPIVHTGPVHETHATCIVQLKTFPEYGFLVWETKYATTQWTLSIGNGMFGVSRKLVCLCNSGCMDDAQRRSHYEYLKGVCMDKGINRLFTRHGDFCSEGFEIRDGDIYEYLMRQNPDIRKKERYVSL